MGGLGEAVEEEQQLAFPVFQYHRKRKTPSSMITVEPERMMFMWPTWKPSMLTAFWLLPDLSSVLGGEPGLHMVT